MISLQPSLMMINSAALILYLSAAAIKSAEALHLPPCATKIPPTTNDGQSLSRRKLITTSITAASSLSLLAPPLPSVAKSADKQWKQWTCDELTPKLCDDLEVSTGELVIRSIPVKYWRYKRRKNGSSSNIDADDDDSKSSSLPIIAVHGGPGYPHNYMLPLKQLACNSNREVIFYDQAGCGQSTQRNGKSVSPTKYPHLLDPAYYSEEELPALIEHWKLDQYHILGHSWGTMIAQLFALNAKDTRGLRSLILSGPLSDAKSYIDAQWKQDEGSLGSLPPFVQGRIRALEKEGAYNSAEYGAIADVLTTFFTVRTAPAPDCFTTALAGLNEEVYVGMQGPSEFALSGVLGDFHVSERLHEIDVPVLLTHGVYDTMRPSIVKAMEKELKYPERVVFPHSGHVSMIDDPEMMNDVVNDFVHRVEGKKRV